MIDFLKRHVKSVMLKFLAFIGTIGATGYAWKTLPVYSINKYLTVSIHY